MRWVTQARVSMQRPGHLIAVAAAASETVPTNLAGLAGAYAAIVRRTHRLDDPAVAERVVSYIQSLRLWKRYGGHQGALARLSEPGALPPVERQDLWLSDPRLPSATGAVTDEVIQDFPQLGSSLGIVRPHNFTRSDRGKAIVALWRDQLERLADGGADDNLFRLVASFPPGQGDRPGAACYLLYSLIEGDGDFAAAAWATQLEEGATRFTRAKFGELMPSACRRLADTMVRRRDASDRPMIARLDALARHIEERTPKTERTWGGGRPRDQVATLRLEPFVDFGLVTRLSRTDYSYELAPRQAAFFAALAEAPSIASFLDDQLVGSFAEGIGAARSKLGADDIWKRLQASYEVVRSALGYASARELTLLAIATLLDEGTGAYFEVSDGLEVLRARQQESPTDIKYGVSRTGAPIYVRLEKGARS